MRQMRPIKQTLFILFLTYVSYANAERVTGDGNRVNINVKVQPFHSIEIEGPFNAKISKKDHPYKCTNINFYLDENLFEHISITEDNGVLKLSTTVPILPSKIIRTSFYCLGLKSIKVSNYSQASIHLKDGDKLTASVDNAFFNISGRASYIKAQVQNSGVINLKTATINKADYQVTNGGYIVSSKPSNSYKATQINGGEIHLYEKGHHQHFQKRIKSGVFLRAKGHDTGKFLSLGHEFVDWEQVKKRMLKEEIAKILEH